jgi:hypothetical protein
LFFKFYVSQIYIVKSVHVPDSNPSVVELIGKRSVVHLWNSISVLFLLLFLLDLDNLRSGFSGIRARSRVGSDAATVIKLDLLSILGLDIANIFLVNSISGLLVSLSKSDWRVLSQECNIETTRVLVFRHNSHSVMDLDLVSEDFAVSSKHRF